MLNVVAVRPLVVNTSVKGADHYKEAERLLAPPVQASGHTYMPSEQGLRRAQVHATLALAAAVERQTRLTTGMDDGGYS